MDETIGEMISGKGIRFVTSFEKDGSDAVPQIDQKGVILATAGHDHTIKLWEAISGTCSRTIHYTDSQVNRLAISPDKRFLAAAGNPHVRLYDCHSQNANPLLSFSAHASNVTGIAFHAETKWMATSSEDGTVKIWDLRSPNVQRDYSHGCAVNDVVIHPNQGEVISCDQAGCVKIWDLGENINTHTLIPEEDVPARSIAVANDGNMLIAGNNKGKVYVWRMDNNEKETRITPTTKFHAHNKYLNRCVLSSDAQFLATCSADRTVKIWSTDNNTFALIKALEGHQRWVWDCAFSADSAYLVTGSSDHIARLWELSSGKIVRQYSHSKGILALALNDYVT